MSVSFPLSQEPKRPSGLSLGLIIRLTWDPKNLTITLVPLSTFVQWMKNCGSGHFLRLSGSGQDLKGILLRAAQKSSGTSKHQRDVVTTITPVCGPCLLNSSLLCISSREEKELVSRHELL